MALSDHILSVIAYDTVISIIQDRKIKHHSINCIKTSDRIIDKRLINLLIITGYLHTHFVKIP